MAIKTFTYKLYNHKKNKNLHRMITMNGLLYNHILSLYNRYYHFTRTFDAIQKGVTYKEAKGKLPHKYAIETKLIQLKRTCKKFNYILLLPSRVLHYTIARLNNAIKMACKKDNNRRWPHFRKIKEYPSFTFDTASYKFDESNHRVTIMKRDYKYFKDRNLD